MIQAEKLVFLSDVPGIYLDRKDPSTLQSHLNSAQCRELIASGVIDAGMMEFGQHPPNFFPGRLIA